MKEEQHAGHRARLRERFLLSGIDCFAPHEVLELALCYALPRVDTNLLAHRLIERFGSLGAVLSAAPEELAQVEGIGERAAVFLSLLGALPRRIAQDSMGENPILANLRDASAYCRALLCDEKNEVLYVICLNAQGRVIRAVRAVEGTTDEVPLYPRTVMEIVMRHSAQIVLLAHNHPSGSAVPSEADEQITQRVGTLLEGIGVQLMDHLIVAGGEVCSLNRWRTEGQL